MSRWKFFFSSLVNYAPDDDGAGGGGSGEGAGGGSGDAAPEPLSEAARELIMQTTNAAITSQLNRKLGPAIQQGMQTAMQPFQEQLTAALGGTPGQPAPGQPNANPEIAALQRQNENMQKQLDSERKERESSATKVRESARNSAVQNALATAGVEPLRMRGAMAEVMNNVQIGDDGQAFFRSNTKGYDEDFALADGINSWAQTDTGKAYLAPKQVNGSGASAHGHQSGNPGGQQQPAGTKDERIAQARAALPGQVARMLGGGAGVRFGGNDGQGQG